MPKIVATAEVEDIAKWESGFKTHTDLFTTQTVNSPICYSTNEDGNRITILFEVDDLDVYLKGLELPETAEAMAFDGIKRETVNFTVLDKACEF